MKPQYLLIFSFMVSSRARLAPNAGDSVGWTQAESPQILYKLSNVHVTSPLSMRDLGARVNIR